MSVRFAPPPAVRVPAPRPAEGNSPKKPAGPRIADSTYDLAHRICADGWPPAVESRLASVLSHPAWSRVRKRPDWLCGRLAEAAEEIEHGASARGEALGRAATVALGWGRQARLVQDIVRSVVAKAVPKIGGSRTAAVVHGLRVIGIWSCVAREVPLRSCPCFHALATGRTEVWISDELARHLTGLGSPVTDGR